MKISYLQQIRKIGAVIALSVFIAFLSACDQQTSTESTETTPDQESEAETTYGGRDQQETDPAAQHGEPTFPDEGQEPPPDEIQPERNLRLQESLQGNQDQQPDA
ncbi:MAG TPA: hypothetical protein VK041_09795 [Opitutales bacterium]|nr:hypothetical protein [Opitutales bacterium]